jgi:quercetin dioxygenase-like cupin family protein
MVTYADAPLTVVNPVATMPLAPTPSNAEIVTVSIELPPRDPGLPAHRHPGPVYGYMIEGEMVLEVEDEPARVIRTGEAFWEPGGDRIHYVAANPTDTPARFVALLFVPPGEEPLTFVDETELQARKHRRVGA